jgi:hypothetical protein
LTWTLLFFKFCRVGEILRGGISLGADVSKIFCFTIIIITGIRETPHPAEGGMHSGFDFSTRPEGCGYHSRKLYAGIA